MTRKYQKRKRGVVVVKALMHLGDHLASLAAAWVHSASKQPATRPH